MLEFVKSLGIDPIKECEMLWLAEEALNADLPPDWESRKDAEGRPHFHNTASGVSSWQHPMDSFFKQMVQYWRQAHSAGGFWVVDDELGQSEENVRRDLDEWMELFDENRQKFFHNRRTQESRFDDPRIGVQHDLYARASMVARMKQKAPLLASAPRPDELTATEMYLLKLQEDEEDRFIGSVVKIQSKVRGVGARKRVGQVKHKNVVDKGNQPLKHRLQLRVESLSPGGAKEVVLTETGSHREFMAAQKLQARSRGNKTRTDLAAVTAHRAYLTKTAKIIQRAARAKLARRHDKQGASQRLKVSVVAIQSFTRGRKARRYVVGLREERARFNDFTNSVIKCQSVLRMALAKKVVRKKRAHRQADCIFRIQQKMKVWTARNYITKLRQAAQPVEMVFALTLDPQVQQMMPWSWKLVVHPVDRRGVMQDHTYKSIDVFSNAGPSNFEAQAAAAVQKVVRGKQTRSETAEKRGLVRMINEEVFDGAYRRYEIRYKAAARIQKHARGCLIRRNDILGARQQKWQEKVLPKIERAQAYLQRFLAQTWLARFSSPREDAAVMIQSLVRGRLARRQVEHIREELLWPLKGWFQYTGMATDSVQVEVQFFANPRFSEFEHFCAFGGYDELNQSLETMTEGISKATESVAKLYADEDADKEARQVSKQNNLAKQEAERQAEEDERRAAEARKAEDEARWAAKEEAARKAGEAKQEAYQKAKEEAAQKERDEADRRAKEVADKKASEEAAVKAMEEAERVKEEAKEAAKEAARSATPVADVIENSAEVLPIVSDQGYPKVQAKSQKNPSSPMDAIPSPKTCERASDATGPDEVSEIENTSCSTPSPKAYLSGTRDAVNAVLLQKRKHYAGTFKDGRFLRTHACGLEELSEEQKSELMADIEEARKQKVAELVRRQKKHAAKQRKEQKREAKQLGNAVHDQISGAERRQKVEELKNWLKRKEQQEAEQAQTQGLSPSTPVDVEKRRHMMAMTMASIQEQRQRVMHRHVHHHVHYHDGAPAPDEADGQLVGVPMPSQSASAVDLRSTAPAMGEPWRPLVHSASAGYVG